MNLKLSFIQKYGYTLRDKILNNLGSMLTTNHRCDTLEQCALLRAFYDADGLDINDKRNDLSFATIMQEWKDHVQENYSIVKMN